MVRGDRRGCVKLKNAQVGINDEDDSTFTITVDSKIFHFQAQDAGERQKWLDALQEARDLHTENYALLQHRSRLLDPGSSVSEFDRRIIEADAYLQILIDQHQELDLQLSNVESFPHEACETIKLRLQRLIELVKKTIVCLQFAKDVGENKLENSGTAMVNLLDSPFDDEGLAYQYSLTALRESQPISNENAGASTSKPASQKQLIIHTPSPLSQTSPAASLDLDMRSTTSPTPSERHRLALGPVPAVSYSSDEDEKDVFFDTHEHPLSVSPASFVTITDEFRDCSSPSLSIISNDLPTELARRIPVEHRQLEYSVGTLNLDVNSDSQSPVVQITGDLGPGVDVLLRATPLKYSQVFAYDELYDADDEKDLGSIQSQGSVISYLLSQLRIGMDLTRITLPTFILEKRSTLEMYADFLAHPDLWIAIVDGVTPKDRMVACLRWYLSAFHASRKSAVCKKPYNPILGEVFRCCWPVTQSDTDPIIDATKIPVTYPEEELAANGPMPYAADDCVVFLSEQVSHHPPVSAFYAEYQPKHIQVAGNIWTKSKFLGLSIGVEMVGSATINVIDLEEEYTVTFPSAFGRNILTIPWVELGGRTSLSCPKTGYSATVEFRTKPFYGGKKDQIRAEAFAPGEKKPFLVVEGEWNGQMFIKDLDNTPELFVDTKQLPIIAKKVRPREMQETNESRRLWESVTRHLKVNNIDAATDAKARLEQRQRKEAAARQETKSKWNCHFFTENGGMYPYRWPLTSRLCPEATTNCWSSVEVIPEPTSSSNIPVAISSSPDSGEKLVVVD